MSTINMSDAGRSGRDAVQQAEQLEHFRAVFSRLREGLAGAQRQDEEERRRTASAFNIFQVLGRTYDEVETHSRLLANLLNPHGSHGQGTLFLERFLHRHHSAFAGAPPLPKPLLAADWKVEIEYAMRDGRLDLVVSSPALGYLCIIENKLLASEQPDQLARYWRWMREEQSHLTYQALFYLTPDGRASATCNEALYYRLAYRTDIAGWLEESLAAVEAPRLSDLLSQYLDMLNDV